MKYYIIGTKKPKGSVHEAQITHYKVAFTLEDAKESRGPFMLKKDFIEMITPEDEVFAYDPRDGRMWSVKVASIKDIN